jgi:hypothetical protein
MFYKVLMFLIIGLVPSLLFGYIVIKKFERLLAPQVVEYLWSRKLRTLFWSAFGFGWPVLIFYLSIDTPPEFDLGEALFAFTFGVIAMMAGATWRKSERKKESGKRLQGERTGY